MAPAPGYNPGYAPGGYGYGYVQPTESKAVTALVLGLVSLFCFGPLTGIPAAIIAPAETAPTGRRLKFRALLPIRPQFIVFLALRWVAEHLVGLVDFLEFLLGFFLVLGDVGMIFPRQFAKSLLDLGIAREPRHAETFVIIFILDCHIHGIATCEIAAILETMMPVVSFLSKLCPRLTRTLYASNAVCAAMG